MAFTPTDYKPYDFANRRHIGPSTADLARMLDVLGNIPFMRLVRPRERPEMTSVLTVGRDLSFVLTPALAAIVLLFGTEFAAWR